MAKKILKYGLKNTKNVEISFELILNSLLLTNFKESNFFVTQEKN